MNTTWFKSNNNALVELTVRSMYEILQKLKDDPDCFYFTVATQTTDPFLKIFHLPSKSTPSRYTLTAKLIGLWFSHHAGLEWLVI
jgi:hypothetical protein